MNAPTWAQPGAHLMYVPRTYTPAEIIAAYQAGHVTDEALWRWSTRWDVPALDQCQVFRALGLRVWAGFPLVRETYRPDEEETA